MINDKGFFHVVVEAIIEKDGKILITQRSLDRDHAPGEWETLTGRVGQGETLEEAVKREVKEETQLDVEIIAPFNTFHFYRGKEKEEHQGISFWCRWKKGEVILDTKEQIAYKWVTPIEALQYLKRESIIKSIQQFINMCKQY